MDWLYWIKDWVVTYSGTFRIGHQCNSLRKAIAVTMEEGRAWYGAVPAELERRIRS